MSDFAATLEVYRNIKSIPYYARAFVRISQAESGRGPVTAEIQQGH